MTTSVVRVGPLAMACGHAETLGSTSSIISRKQCHGATLACLAGAFGRTMSPVAAVVVYSSGLVGVSPVVLVRRLLPALLGGAVVAISMTMVRASG